MLLKPSANDVSASMAMIESKKTDEDCLPLLFGGGFLRAGCHYAAVFCTAGMIAIVLGGNGCGFASTVEIMGQDDTNRNNRALRLLGAP